MFLTEQGRKGSARPALARLALSKAEAAEVLGVSVDYLDEHVLPELRIVYRGRRRLIPIRELERWLDVAAINAPDAQR